MMFKSDLEKYQSQVVLEDSGKTEITRKDLAKHKKYCSFPYALDILNMIIAPWPFYDTLIFPTSAKSS
jgi:hypothetical protein